MKKLLLATTALVASAGFAAAGVAITGSAEMGVDGGTGMDTQFQTDLNVTFAMSGSTDNGLTFGASVDLSSVGNGSNSFHKPFVQGDESIFISGPFGTLTMGDTDGAMDWALTEAGNVGNPGSINDDETSHQGYLGSYLDGKGDGQIARWSYNAGSFGIAISAEQNLNGAAFKPLTSTASHTGYAIGVKYGMDLGASKVNFGFGYQQAYNNNVAGTTFNGGSSLAAGDKMKATGFSVNGSFAGGFKAGVEYTHFSLTGNNVNHIGIGGGYASGPVSIGANYGEFNPSGSGATIKGYGLAADYDLGGGAKIQAGYGHNDAVGAGSSSNTWSLGLSMNF